MTLREVVQAIEAAAWRLRQSERQCILTAWYTAVMANQAFAGKLEKLEDYLPDDGPEGPSIELPSEQEQMMWLLLGATPVEVEP